MGNKATEPLREDHAAVLKKLDAVDRICQRPDQRPETTSELKELAAFFDTEFWVHFTKEEEALFPEMGTFMPANGGPIAEMLLEHKDLREINAKWQDAVRAYLSGDGKAAKPMKEHSTQFTGILRPHIEKENNILFVMAERGLAPAQQEKVARGFSNIEAKQSVGKKKG